MMSRPSRTQPSLLFLALTTAPFASLGEWGATARAAPPAPIASEARALTAAERLSDRDLALAWAKPSNQDASNFAEQIRVVARLDGGGEVFTRLMVTNVAKYDGRAELVTKVELPDGRVYQSQDRRDRGEWTHGVDLLEASVGDAQIRAGVGWLEVHAETAEFELKYRIETALPPLRPAGGQVATGGVFYTTTVLVPRGRLTGTLTLRGAQAPALGGEAGADVGDERYAAEGDEGDASPRAPAEGEKAPRRATATISLSGVAWVEHRATDLAPYRMARRWYKLTQVSAERTVAMSVFEKGRELGGGLQGWALVAEGDALRFYERDLALTARPGGVDPDTAYALPSYVFFFDDPRGPRGIVRGNTVSERRDDLGRLSRLERVVVRRLMQPWTFIYREAEYLFKAPGDAGDTIWRGTATFEYQQLNPD